MWDIHERELTDTIHKPTKKKKHDPAKYADYIEQQVNHLEEMQQCRKGDLA